MDTGLRGKVGVVTGAASGIGRAAALAFAGEGADLALVDIDGDGLAEVADEAGRSVGVATATADLASAAGVSEGLTEALSTYDGRVDVLVNNVGAARPRTFEELTDEQFEATLQLNLFSHLRAIRHVLPAMRSAGGGAIVNVASDLGYEPSPHTFDYSIAKTAVLSLTKVMGRAEAPSIRVNAVAPGPIWTPLWTEPGGYGEVLSEIHGMPTKEAVEHQMRADGLPAGRLGTPEEVANVIVLLASDLTSYVTATTWSVDGGSVRAL